MNLSELVKTQKGHRSYAEVSRDCGGTPSAKRLQQLARQPIKNFPDPPTVRALSRGLMVPQRVVILAAARSLGLFVEDSQSALVQMLPPMTWELSDAQAASIAHLVDLIVRDPIRLRGSMMTEDDLDDSSARVVPISDEPTVAQVRATGTPDEDVRELPMSARKVGQQGSLGRQRDEQDRTAEPLADDRDDMEPR